MKQVIRYVIIGVLSNIIGYSVYLFLTWGNVEPKLAMSIVYISAAMIGFIGNRRWTFNHSGKKISVFFKYTIAHGFGYGINYMILLIFVDTLLYPHEVVQAIAIIVVAIFLFTTFRHIVFSD